MSSRGKIMVELAKIKTANNINKEIPVNPVATNTEENIDVPKLSTIIDIEDYDVIYDVEINESGTLVLTNHQNNRLISSENQFSSDKKDTNIEIMSDIPVEDENQNDQKELDSMSSSISEFFPDTDISTDEDTNMVTENSNNCQETQANVKCSRAITKLRRMKGASYMGYSRTTNENKSVVLQNCSRAARQQNPTCKSVLCTRSRMRFCSDFSEKERNTMFTLFWDMTWDQKKIYVLGLIEEVAKVAMTTHDKSRRSYTYIYYLLNDNGQRLQVCQKMFLGTLGLSEKMVREWRNKSEKFLMQLNPATASDKRKSSKSVTAITSKLRLEQMKNYFKNFPKLESHYCRKDTKKEYF